MKRTADDVLALLTEHGERLFALLYRLTLRADVADDLLQDLFCKLAASNGFGRADNRLAYAYRAATNLAFDWRRQQKRSPPTEANGADLISIVDSPLADMVRREELEQTLNAIGELPQPSREIIVLRYLERQDYDQIAQQVGKSTHQIRAIAHKALVKLRATVNANSPLLQEPRQIT